MFLQLFLINQKCQKPNDIQAFKQTPGEGDGCPVDDLEEGDEAEAKAKSKEAAK